MTIQGVQIYPLNKYQSKMFTTNTVLDYGLGNQVVTKSTSDIQSTKMHYTNIDLHGFTWKDSLI